jgi:hypothetical protein
MDWSSDEGRRLLRAAYAGTHIQGARTLGGFLLSNSDGAVAGVHSSILQMILDEDPDAILPIPNRADPGSWALLIGELLRVLGQNLEGAHLHRRTIPAQTFASTWVLRGAGGVQIPLPGYSGDDPELAIVSAQICARERSN